ncbi:MAG: nitroreductase family protein [Bacteroidales bacterium]|nr:nitroreductase family protein [Bacteroidales bacterium]
MKNIILNHRSIRKYKDKEIEKEIIDRILEAGIRASNTGSMQAYSIIVTQDKEKKQALLPLHFNQEAVKQAPLILTFCADLNRFNKWCKLRDANPVYDNFLWFYTASIDATITAQNCAIAAEAEELGICYMGTTNYTAEKIIEVLELPKGVVPVTTLTIGWPDEEPGLTSRLPEAAVVHYESYSDFSDEDINKIYSESESSEFSKQLIKENKTETLAQVFTEKRYTGANNIHFSKSLLEVIKKQGFWNH